MSSYGYIGVSTGKYHVTGDYKNFVPGTCRIGDPVALKFEGVTYISRFRGTVKVTANEWVDLRLDDVFLLPLQGLGTIVSKSELTKLSKIDSWSISENASLPMPIEVFGCHLFPTGRHWFRTAYFNSYCYVNFDHIIPSHHGTPFIPDNLGVFFLTKDIVPTENGKSGVNSTGLEDLPGEMDLVFDDIHCVAYVADKMPKEGCKETASTKPAENNLERVKSVPKGNSAQGSDSSTSDDVFSISIGTPILVSTATSSPLAASKAAITPVLSPEAPKTPLASSKAASTPTLPSQASSSPLAPTKAVSLSPLSSEASITSLELSKLCSSIFSYNDSRIGHALSVCIESNFAKGQLESSSLMVISDHFTHNFWVVLLKDLDTIRSDLLSSLIKIHRMTKRPIRIVYDDHSEKVIVSQKQDKYSGSFLENLVKSGECRKRLIGTLFSEVITQMKRCGLPFEFWDLCFEFCAWWANNKLSALFPGISSATGSSEKHVMEYESKFGLNAMVYAGSINGVDINGGVDAIYLGPTSFSDDVRFYILKEKCVIVSNKYILLNDTYYHAKSLSKDSYSLSTDSRWEDLLAMSEKYIHFSILTTT